ncbi:class I glutamine amidotransferase-like protein [Fomitiporia mediterranea MF3/22]|uniref:class I glutamine amidotransferase-like protein n=1 Tax=Fomitiporia mediterranea (strain MF3/22) TaxID=694068 RepID=UPI0004408CCD|nr:class I glutamine amidotransferase-like protein [Fomitiporia mediterranea MF3/22]EJD03100.1 class I glutamine amidotransferase-like protein [Fomitiporia mediterranea MF3/22]
MTEVLTVAICLFNQVVALDYQGPVEFFGFLGPDNPLRSYIDSPISMRLIFLSHNLDPVIPGSGPAVLPQATYNDALASKIQYDILLVPGGAEARPETVHADLLKFLKQQIPGARYVLTVCTGSWVLAGTGALDGKRATTNKFLFRSCKAATSDKIEWVVKARWVVDGKIWTASGIAAGADMANAFLVHLVGKDVAERIRGIVELSAKAQDEDEFAGVYGLLDETS